MSNLKSKLKINICCLDDLHRVKNSIIKFCNKNNVISEETDIIEMAILEACHNAIRYGTKEINKSLCKLELIYDNESITAIVKNYGKAFKVDIINEFSIEENFMQFKDGGLGIPLIKSLMDSVEYQRKANNLNELVMVKHITKLNNGANQ